MFNHHEPDCPDFSEPNLAETQDEPYGDIFCDCHRYPEPQILANGTTIAWPAEWTEEQAKAWRSEHNLEQPR